MINICAKLVVIASFVLIHMVYSSESSSFTIKNAVALYANFMVDAVESAPQSLENKNHEEIELIKNLNALWAQKKHILPPFDISGKILFYCVGSQRLNCRSNIFLESREQFVRDLVVFVEPICNSWQLQEKKNQDDSRMECFTKTDETLAAIMANIVALLKQRHENLNDLVYEKKSMSGSFVDPLYKITLRMDKTHFPVIKDKLGIQFLSHDTTY